MASRVVHTPMLVNGSAATGTTVVFDINEAGNHEGDVALTRRALGLFEVKRG
ncbi:hypothetical protein [Micromonospora gifhornensis]|uniref:hypothetical protein n=1 Tax=Micromonospora gifhornensis TaxID=84594 RepID=UPI00365E2BF2